MVMMTTSKNSTVTKKQMLLNFLLREKMAKLETNTISLQQPPSPTTTMIYMYHWAQLKYKLTILCPIGPQGTELCLTFRILFWSSLKELHSTKSFRWKGQFWSSQRYSECINDCLYSNLSPSLDPRPTSIVTCIAPLSEQCPMSSKDN